MTVASANARRAAFLIRSLVEYGVREFVLSPGSRNTPLILAVEALTEQLDGVRIHRILDERSAGFFALGLGRASGKPAVLICTSGSAGAHYLPAVIEAHQACVPMVIVSADRPPELHGCGALQTVEQEDFYGRRVRFSQTLPVPSVEEEELQGWLGGVMARSMDATLGAHPGPVHLNQPFREPLWDATLDYRDLLREPLILPAMTRAAPSLSALDSERLRTLANRTLRGVIVAGPSHGPRAADAGSLREAMYDAARARGWPIIAEPDSGLRFGQGSSDVVISSADSLLRDPALCKWFAPELVIRIGQTPTSKPLRHWLRDYAKGAVVSVDAFATWQDPDSVMSELVVAEPESFVRECLSSEPEQPVDDQWLPMWREADDVACRELESELQRGTWEGAAARELVQCLPRGAVMHVANSMPIRDLDGFGGKRVEAIEVFSNRGANGIDGLISSAAGEATARGVPMLALSGDLSVLHDLSGLGVAKQAQASVTLAVMDNRGGGIFEHLPIAKHPSAFEKNFITPHEVDIAELVSSMGIRSVTVDSIGSFSEAILDEIERPGLGVVVLRVEREFSTERHRHLWARVAERVRAEVLT